MHWKCFSVFQFFIAIPLTNHRSSVNRQRLETSWKTFSGNTLSVLGTHFLPTLLLSHVTCPEYFLFFLFCFFSSSSSFCSLVFLIWATDSISWPGWWLSRQLMAPAQVKTQETFESLTFCILRSLSMFERQVSKGNTPPPWNENVAYR